MAKLPQLRLMIDPVANSGAWNMAVDEALLESAIEEDVATLRWYAWNVPTVSLGYFQREMEVLRDPRLAELPRVRRLSGGGTLVHDRELTYSLTLPASQRVIERPVDLYRLMHSAVAQVLCGRGVEATLRGLTNKRAIEPDLCFAREDEHDLVLRGHKILGSAQRRRRGAILQHGGLMLGASPITPELPGIAELCPAADLADLSRDLAGAILRELAADWHSSALTSPELETVARILRRDTELADEE